jgi:ABC-type lipoprotein export system ATPase subunit
MLMGTHSVEAAALANVVVRLRDGQITEVTRR